MDLECLDCCEGAFLQGLAMGACGLAKADGGFFFGHLAVLQELCEQGCDVVLEAGFPAGKEHDAFVVF